MDYEQDMALEEVRESPNYGERRVRGPRHAIPSAATGSHALLLADDEVDVEGTVVIVGVAVIGDIKDMVGMEDTGPSQRPDPYDDFDDMLHSDYDLDSHHDPFKPKQTDGQRF
ncbi:MAG: hypothetical protein Q9215_006600 [Flavoplaca cf. flavocitrina]